MERSSIRSAIGGIGSHTLREAARDVTDDDMRVSRRVRGLAFLIHESVIGIECVDDYPRGRDRDGAGAGCSDFCASVVIPCSALKTREQNVRFAN